MRRRSARTAPATARAPTGMGMARRRRTSALRGRRPLKPCWKLDLEEEAAVEAEAAAGEADAEAATAADAAVAEAADAVTRTVRLRRPLSCSVRRSSTQQRRGWPSCADGKLPGCARIQIGVRWRRLSVCFRPIARQRSPANLAAISRQRSPAGGAPAAFFMWSHRCHLRSPRRSQTLPRHLTIGLGTPTRTPTIAGRQSRREKRSRCLRRCQRRCQHRCARPRHPCSPRHPGGFQMVRTCRYAHPLGPWNASLNALPRRLSAPPRRRRRAPPPTAARWAPCPPRMPPPSPPAPSPPRMRIMHSPRLAARPSP